MKYLTFIILSFCACFSYAQKIKTDRIDSNGIRFIETTTKGVGGPALSNNITLGLVARIDQDKESWFINLIIDDCKPIPAGSAFLLKLDDGNIITLTSVSDATSTSSSIPITLSTGFVMAVPVHKAYVTYPITKEDLHEIMANEVVKIRIESPDKVFDRKIKGNVTKITNKMYDLIVNRLKSNVEVKSIYDDF